MATKIWRGDAVAVAQVDTFTPANVEIDDEFTITINGKAITFDATAATVANVCTGLVALLSASTIPEFAEITWEDDTTHITATAKVAGKPFTAASSAVDGGSADDQTFTRAAVTASAGPNHWDTADNWSASGVPADGDDVYIENSSVDILYGLDQSAVSLASLNIARSFEGRIGLPRLNIDAGSGASAYFEYRPQYLITGDSGDTTNTVVRIGYGEGQGSSRIKLNHNTGQMTCHILSSGASQETGVPPILLLGSHASNVVNVSRGIVGIAFFGGETAVVATLTVGFQENQQGDSEVYCGEGVTLTTVTKMGGSLVTRSAMTTLNLRQDSGNHVHHVGNITTVNAEGGTFDWRAQATITTLNIGGNSTVECSRNPRAKTITTLSIKTAGITINDPGETLTITNAVALPPGVQINDVNLNLGGGKSLTIAG